LLLELQHGVNEDQMTRNSTQLSAGLADRPGTCDCLHSETSRRDFLVRTSCALAAALAASGVAAEAARAFPVGFTRAESQQGTERSYAMPSEDGVNIDADNDVILIRHSNRIYAFSLSCPHENTALRWRPQDQRFQCPRHESKYTPDGTFISGRATRNMDRYAVRLSGQKVIVDLTKLYRSDQQKAEWDAALITL
jgi:nitrite reductase/ring-hydroxylating ferredoxin subunit